jgi:hypothetical protein
VVYPCYFTYHIVMTNCSSGISMMVYKSTSHLYKEDVSIMKRNLFKDGSRGDSFTHGVIH